MEVCDEWSAEQIGAVSSWTGVFPVWRAFDCLAFLRGLSSAIVWTMPVLCVGCAKEWTC